MKGVLALTVSLIALAVWSSPASAATSGRVCLTSGQCGTLTAQLVTAAHPYTGMWPAQGPQTGLGGGQVQVAVQLQWDEADPSTQDLQGMQTLVNALPVSLHVDGKTIPAQDQLQVVALQTYDTLDWCSPSCDGQGGHYYMSFQLSTPIDLATLTGGGQHSVSASLGYVNLVTNTISLTLGGKPSTGGSGSSGSSATGPQICDSNGLCGTVSIRIDTSDAPDWYEQYAPQPFDRELVDGTIAADLTVTFASSDFVSQAEVQNSDLFAHRPLTLHVGSRSYQMKPLVLGQLPSDGKSMWCKTCKGTPSYYADWVLPPIKLSSYQAGNSKIWFTIAGGHGSTIKSDTLDLTGSNPKAGNKLTVTKLGPRTVKVTLTSAQLVEAGAKGRLDFLATRSNGVNWIGYKLDNKLVKVDGKHTSISVVFHLPAGGRWCFEELGAIFYGGRPHVVYTKPQYLTIK